MVWQDGKIPPGPILNFQNRTKPYFCVNSSVNNNNNKVNKTKKKTQQIEKLSQTFLHRAMLSLKQVFCLLYYYYYLKFLPSVLPTL